ncbi:MAG: ribonuclease H-like domain-containing protein [Nitrospirota bacterium]
MIKNTFSILDGIGQKLEKRLWREGILTWSDFLSADNLSFINTERKRLMDESLFFADNELSAGNAAYFANNLKRYEHWRLFDVFRDNAVCLDIETNGLPSDRGGYVTLVGLYNGNGYKYFIRKENFTAEALNEELSRYKFLITFYGSVFDIPFLRWSIPGLNLNIPHFDLCFGARKLGLRGGLKKLEPYFGIQRYEEVRGMDGYDAVLLWQRARMGDSRALELLMLYNKEDTVNLFTMADIIYSKLRALTGIEEYL